jgi:tetratricopeptide (TPR) repeat protein
MACDEMVTARLMDAGAYARSMVSLAAGMTSPAHPGYTLGVFDGDILEERIRRLLSRRVANLRQARLLLIGGLAALAVCAVVASGLALSARAQSDARPELTAGVQAFISGDFQAAIQHFEAAVHLEPANLPAKLHLADAYIAAHQGHRQSGLLQRARQQYEDVLSLDPTNQSAILGLVSISGSDESPRSRELLQRLLAADHGNATAYYFKVGQNQSYTYIRRSSRTGFDPGSYWEIASHEQNFVDGAGRALIAKLKSAGLSVVLMRRGDDNLYHIVLGPYKDDAQLREAKTKLESLGFHPKLR